MATQSPGEKGVSGAVSQTPAGSGATRPGPALPGVSSTISGSGSVSSSPGSESGPASGSGSTSGGDDNAPLLSTARTRARSAFHQQQERIAENIGEVASALHRAAQQIQDRNAASPIAHYADSAAQRVERLADSIRGRDLDDLIGETERFARRQPELFLGGAVAVGLVIARVVRASADRRRAHDSGDGRPGDHRHRQDRSTVGMPAAGSYRAPGSRVESWQEARTTGADQTRPQAGPGSSL